MIRLSPRAALCAALCLAALAAQAARAQERDAPKVEVGGHFTALDINPAHGFGGSTTEPGVGGRFAYNVTDWLGLEAELNFLPRRAIFGRTTQGQFGVKAGKRFRRFGIFAKARPGFVSFGEEVVVTGVETVTVDGRTINFPVFANERRTHLSVDVGGVVEFYPSRKLLVRADVGDTIVRHGPQNLPPNLFFTPFLPEGYSHNFQITTGVAYRFLNPDGADEQDPPAAGPREHRFEAGIQYTALNVNPPTEITGFPVIGERPTFTEPAVGGRLGFNINDHVALEGAVDFITRRQFSGPTFGGRAIQGQFGVKAGRRFERFGLFGKARPGFLSYGSVQHLVGTELINFGGSVFEVGRFEPRRKTYFETDLGGVVEFYPSRRVLTRFDFGDTIIRYRGRVGPGISLGQSIIRQPDETRHNFQFNAGLGFRF